MAVKNNGTDYVRQMYVMPPLDKISVPKEHRNLVMIYVESFEATFQDKNLFGTNLQKSLSDIDTGVTSFAHYRQLYGTGWTIAGAVASQCGVPIKMGNRIGEYAEYFLPGAVCMGDVLKNAGYTNVFMQGVSLGFGAHGRFFHQHGFDELYGLEEWKEQGEPLSEWGLYDDRLFERAKERLDQLYQSNQPFNLTFMTIDTHGPEGLFSPTCSARGVNDYAGIVSCTSDQLAEFVRYIREKGYDRNTDVVIVGDHMSMMTPLYATLEKSSDRSIFNQFISRRPLDKNRNDIVHFDVYPSVLYMLGFRFDKGRLALGTSAFGPYNPRDSLFYVKDVDRKLRLPSEKYNSFWINMEK